MQQEGAWDGAQLEEMSGARLSFQCWPSSRLEATRSIAPFGALYTPLKKLPQNCAPPSALPYDPVRCSTCHAVLNPYCQVDFHSKLWVCPFCFARNHFPPHYADNITETNLPAELIPQYATCEYELQSVPNQGTPCFLFVIDTCAAGGVKEELAELADSLTQALNLLPQDSLVGLISFGTNVSVYELASEAISSPTSFVETESTHLDVSVNSWAARAVSHNSNRRLRMDNSNKLRRLVDRRKKFYSAFSCPSRNVPSSWSPSWKIFNEIHGQFRLTNVQLERRAVP